MHFLMFFWNKSVSKYTEHRYIDFKTYIWTHVIFGQEFHNIIFSDVFVPWKTPAPSIICMASIGSPPNNEKHAWSKNPNWFWQEDHSTWMFWNIHQQYMFAKLKQKMVGSESFQIKWTYWCFMCTQHAMGGLARQGPQVFFSRELQLHVGRCIVGTKMLLKIQRDRHEPALEYTFLTSHPWCQTKCTANLF